MSYGSDSCILYIDDAELLATGLQACVEPAGFKVSTVPDQKVDFLNLNEFRPELVIIGSVHEGDKRAFNLCREITARNPGMKVILLSWQANEPTVHTDAVSAGACACLPVNIDCRELLDDIHHALAGYSLINSEISLLAHTPENLTKRQREILAAAAHGFSQTEIADQLGISPYTVRNHLAECRARLNVNSTAQAILHARNRGIIE